ncbi:MAG: hypothetical protein NTZ40_12765 [Cyanobacteria bacterium]|nr:hypothetical protein [Cyanobacteriota bacterium]
MAAPERSKHGRGSSPDLPVPWQNPWGVLWRELGAVLASLGLGLRELWRRNGEGSLWRPAFWPQAVALLFWPLLAVALVGLLVFGGRPLVTARRPPPIPPLAGGRSPGPQAERPPFNSGTSNAATSVSPPAPPESSIPSPAAPQPIEAEAPADAPPEPNPGETEPGARGPGPAPPSAPLPPPDPLLQALTPDDPEGWIGATRAEPGASRLDLLLIDRFRSLPDRQRLALASQWQRRAESLGYEDLRLLDGRGHLLARRALVGSGMILLEFPATPPEA